jgi:tetratricopeptide (TPR) repeat protein
MGLFRRKPKASGEPPEQQADDLADLADDLAESEPDSKRAAAAAQRSLDTAEALMRAEETVANRRRVGRALFRQGSAVAQSDRPAAEFVAGARRCWLVSRQAVELTSPQDPQYDLLIGELMQRAGAFVVPVLSEAGHQDEATEVVQFCDTVGQNSPGPHTEQGRARMTLMVLASIADQYVQARLNGQWDDAEAQQVEALRVVAQDTADLLRRHQHDGPLEVTELATALRTLSRLLFVDNEIEAANRTLSEAISLYASVADRGPNYRKFLHAVEAERDSLDEFVRITSSSPESAPAGDWTAPELLADYIAQIDRGIALGREGDLPQAQEVLTAAAAALDLLWQQESAESIDGEPVRHLARARWRLAMVQSLIGNQSQALSTGLLAVQSGRGWLHMLPAGTDQRAQAVAEVATMATDAAQIAFGAGADEEGTELLKEAASLCRRENHPAARRALATILHNRANALITALPANANPSQVRGQLQKAYADALEAVALRRELRSPEDSITWFELANSLLLLSIATAARNERESAAALLAEAVDQALPLDAGPAVNNFRSIAALHAKRLDVAGPQASAS